MTPLISCFQVDEPGVWTELGHAQLDGGAVNEAIASYLRSGDSSRYKDVIARSQEANAHWRPGEVPAHGPQEGQGEQGAACCFSNNRFLCESKE